MTEPGGSYIKVRVGGVEVATTIEEVARCLEELDRVLKRGTAEGADVDCVFKALSYIKKYRRSNERLLEVAEAVDEILRKDLEEGRVTLW